MGFYRGYRGLGLITLVIMGYKVVIKNFILQKGQKLIFGSFWV